MYVCMYVYIYIYSVDLRGLAGDRRRLEGRAGQRRSLLFLRKCICSLFLRKLFVSLGNLLFSYFFSKDAPGSVAACRRKIHK